jgi:hypothetical protein
MKTHTDTTIDLRKFYGEGDKEKHARVNCKQHGCVEKLTLWQSLCSDYCADHQRRITTLDIVDRYFHQ